MTDGMDSTPDGGLQVDPAVRWRVVLASLLSLALVSYVDYVTGYELLFFVFYFFPVSLCGWYLGRPTTLVMAILGGASWFMVDRLSGHVYPNEAIRVWNASICLAAFAIIGLVLQRLRRALAEQERARQKLAGALADLSRSTEEISKLQTELQVVCAWTKRIRIDGQWMAFDKFLAEKLHLSVSHGISPEALEAAIRELDEGKETEEGKPRTS